MKTQIRIASLLLPAILCLTLAVVPAMADTLYSNGPYNGNTAGWGIGDGQAVTESINLNTSRSNVYEVDFVYWDASSSDLLTNVDLSFGSTPFGTDIFSGTVGVTNTFLGTNQYGYAELAGSAIYNIGKAQQSFYLTLSNACTTSGCSTEQIFWDENSGPSTAYDSALGTIPSESFTLIGDSGTTPEPGSLVLFGSGALGLAGILRRRLMG